MRDLAFHQPEESLQSLQRSLCGETGRDLLGKLLGKVKNEVGVEPGSSTNAKAFYNGFVNSELAEVCSLGLLDELFAEVGIEAMVEVEHELH